MKLKAIYVGMDSDLEFLVWAVPQVSGQVDIGLAWMVVDRRTVVVSGGDGDGKK